MALNIISNFAANVATRNLAKTDAAVTASLAKLSSGTRVVSAKDDAASLTIGSRLRAEVAGLKQASVNAGQASSLLQIADGAYATISDILVRTKALAVQSSSGQLSSTERTVLNAEFVALQNEITRISNDTNFNGTSLINGADINTTDNNKTLLSTKGITEIKFDTATFGTDGFVYRLEFTKETDTFKVVALDSNGTDGSGSGPATTSFILTAAQVTAIGNLTGATTLDIAIGSSGITVVVDRNFSEAADILVTTATANGGGITAMTNTATVFDEGGLSAASLKVLTDLAASGEYNANTGELTISLTNVAAGIIVDGLTGITYNTSGVGADEVSFTGTDAQTGQVVAIKVGAETIATLTLDYTSSTNLGTGATVTVNIGQGLVSNDFTANGGATAFTFQVGTGTIKDTDTVSFDIDRASALALGIELATINILTGAAALVAITATSNAIDAINSARANVGASQNRLDFASSNLAASIENAEAARSQLLDLDIASEITFFTSKQVLLQAGVAMLAQANQLPQNLLQLLR